MNREQIRGRLKDTAGMFQRKFGHLFGSESHEMRGITGQAEGKTEKMVGDAKDTMDKTADNLKDSSKR